MSQPAFPWRRIAAGTACLILGIGLARFAYTPIMPMLSEAGWFSPEQLGYIGAANLAGYLLGALVASRAGAMFGIERAIGAAMAATVLSFVACAYPLSFAWYFAWRLLSGVTGGIIVVSGVGLALSGVSAGHRGKAVGMVFSGVGIGFLAASFLVPVLLTSGPGLTWWVLALVASGLTAFYVVSVRATSPMISAVRSAAASSVAPRHAAIMVLGLAYAISAASLVPHMVFFSDFVAIGLGQGVASGAVYAGLMGGGAAVGSVFAGWFMDRFGSLMAVHALFVVEAIGVWLVLFSGSAWVLAPSAVLVGLTISGMVPIISGRVDDLCGRNRVAGAKAWGWMTAGFATGQAVSSQGMSLLFAQTGSHLSLFHVAAVGMVVVIVGYFLIERLFVR